MRIRCRCLSENDEMTAFALNLTHYDFTIILEAKSLTDAHGLFLDKYGDSIDLSDGPVRVTFSECE